MERFQIGRMHLLFSIFLLFSCIIGCDGGKKLVPVTGTLLVDGKPAPGASLLFHPQGTEAGSLATANTDENGKFALVSDMNAGITPGEYKVSVIWPDPAVQPTPAQKMTGMFDAGPDLLKGRYASRDKSTIVIQITGDTEELPPIELSTK